MLVDEDPVDSELMGESSHRSFIIITGKIAFAMIIGIFLPLFLALGLIRDESENGTLHYLLSKPIHRGEFIVYRLFGYLIFAGGFVLLMSLLMAFVTVFLGPDGNRLADFNVWVRDRRGDCPLSCRIRVYLQCNGAHVSKIRRLPRTHLRSL